MSKGIEVSLKASAYRTEESYIALVLCRQRSLQDVRGLPADKTCGILCPPRMRGYRGRALSFVGDLRLELGAGKQASTLSVLYRSRAPIAELADTPLASSGTRVPLTPKLALLVIPNGAAGSSAL